MPAARIPEQKAAPQTPGDGDKDKDKDKDRNTRTKNCPSYFTGDGGNITLGQNKVTID